MKAIIFTILSLLPLTEAAFAGDKGLYARFNLGLTEVAEYLFVQSSIGIGYYPLFEVGFSLEDDFGKTGFGSGSLYVRKNIVFDNPYFKAIYIQASSGRLKYTNDNGFSDNPPIKIKEVAYQTGIVVFKTITIGYIYRKRDIAEPIVFRINEHDVKIKDVDESVLVGITFYCELLTPFCKKTWN